MFYKPYFEKSDIRYRKSALPIACYRLQNTVISDEYYTITPNWHNEMELLYSEAALTLYINNQCYNVIPGDIFSSTRGRFTVLSGKATAKFTLLFLI